ncbi:hypothetical protein [Halorubrum sp. GN11_10-6_MGM]|uniref:hypothetical protein n=1 Tax=Halorubrum sp. GN11_10-6_MGM TaxID=2518112 RepID=UPI00130EC580|nr:hypothetical protein [Halorubrum sp. GN11_10-6_MGM]
MESKSTPEIDALALRIERLIKQNEEVLEDYDENHTSFSTAQADVTAQTQDVDTEELFS